MLKIINNVVVWLCLIGLISFVVYQETNKPVYVYIDTEYLLTNYQGTKDATDKLMGKTERWEATLDSLKSVYMAKKENFIVDSLLLSLEDRKIDKQELLQLKYNIVQLESKMQQGFKQEDQKLSVGVLNKVETELATFCQDRGYTLVLALTPGVTLHAADNINITDEFLGVLNTKYKGE